MLYAGGRDFDRRLFELQALDKDCERDFEMFCQETTHMARTMFIQQITTVRSHLSEPVGTRGCSEN